jgi:DNA processing protein
MVRKVGLEDPGYPELLRSISDAPKQLYSKGVWSEDLFVHCVAVVGSRRMTQYGKRVTEQLVGEIATAGVTIVSGFMYGVDVTAHKTAMEAGGKTIAVMPCGIERIHPSTQRAEYRRIEEEGGLILSEWGGDEQPLLWTYPKRNRIVAGISHATLVVEAALNSGSLITAQLAKQFKRPVFAVPGPITSTTSLGTIQLLKQGSRIVSGSSDILELFHISGVQRSKKTKQSDKNSTERSVLRVLEQEALDIDTLAEKMRMPIAQLGSILSLLELQGSVVQEGGVYYMA